MRKPGVAVSIGLAFALVAGIASQSVVSLRSQVRPASAVATAERAMDALRERLGAAPVECGRYQKPVTDEYVIGASAQCVVDLAAQRLPSWTIVYGGDWLIARGAFSGSDGVVREFTFDSLGPLGDGRATLAVSGPCPAPKFVIKERGSYVTVNCTVRQNSN